MTTRIPIELDEWYHCYSRGVDKRRVFSTKRDYERFLALTYLSNATKTTHLSNLRDTRLSNLLANTLIDRGKSIVELGAFCLMPNHVHFLVKEIEEGGIARFMQKVFTGYTMYFNKLNERTGALFSGTFKSRHVDDDMYFKQAFSYIHVNPAELFVSSWKDLEKIPSHLERRLFEYPYSSLPAFTKQNHPHKKILGTDVYELFDEIPSVRRMLDDARRYDAPLRQG